VLRNISVSWQRMQGGVRVIKVTGASLVSYWELKTPNGNSLGFSPANTLGILTFATSFSGSARLFPVTLRGSAYRSGISVSDAQSGPSGGYSVTPPVILAGSINVASGSFTIESSGIPAPTTITLSSNLAGTFSQALINLPIGSSTQTFTYIPTVVGSHVISFGSALTNPSPINYTANPPVATGSYSITTPATLSGSINNASGSFTINSSGITTPTTVTLSSNLAGIFSQNVIVLPIGSSTQSFNYTPTVVGGHVIFFSSTLTNPSPINYTANPPLPVGNYSVTPPVSLSGFVNVASNSFTIESSGVTTARAVTLSSNLAGTFSQSVIILPVGSSTQAFTYTPTVLGTHVISFNSTLTNPSPINYTSTAQPSGNYTITPPAALSGPINTTSGSFTINSSGVTPATAVTLSSNLGGTFSQSVINLPIGSATQTFTYTPTAVGSHVISFSSPLTNPSPVSYTANSLPPSGGTIILDTQFVTLAGTLAIPVGGSSNYIIRHVTATANGTVSFTGTPTQDMRVEIWNRSAPGIIVTVQTPPDGLALASLNTGLGESKLTLDYDLTSNTWYGVVTNG
jgi:large repetitive protein